MNHPLSLPVFPRFASDELTVINDLPTNRTCRLVNSWTWQFADRTIHQLQVKKLRFSVASMWRLDFCTFPVRESTGLRIVWLRGGLLANQVSAYVRPFNPLLYLPVRWCCRSSHTKSDFLSKCLQ